MRKKQNKINKKSQRDFMDDFDLQEIAKHQREQDLESHGYSSEDEYRDAYYSGETGEELGEPLGGLPDPPDDTDTPPSRINDKKSQRDIMDDFESHEIAKHQREQDLESHGYSSEDEYREAYYSGETGEELGEPLGGLPDPPDEPEETPSRSYDNDDEGGFDDDGGEYDDGGGYDDDGGGYDY